MPTRGEMKWYFQFTPHDTHDWDANETPVLLDAEFQGRQRKLMIQANRNGFFYILDRATGEFLLAKPFCRQTRLGDGGGRERPSDPGAGHGPDSGRGESLSLRERRLELDVPFL